MRKEYDFTQSQKNPYASRLKCQITIRLDEGSITDFKEISEEVGSPQPEPYEPLPARLRGAAPKARLEVGVNV